MICIGKYPSVLLTDHANSLFIKFSYDPETLARIKSLPCRKYVSNAKIWEIPLEDIDRLVTAIGVNNIYCYNEIPEYEHYLNSLVNPKQSMTADQLREYYKTLQCRVDYPFKSTPMGHQIEAINMSLDEDKFFITDVMGLGKTAESIYIMDYKIGAGLVNSVLVICGVNKIKYNWQNKEIPQHSRYTSQIIDGTKKKRLEKIQHAGEYAYNIINVESLRNDDLLDALMLLCNQGVINAIIVDEFHKINNHKSKQGANTVKLKAPYMIGLSGTPITKHPELSWNVLHWFGFESSSYYQFCSRYCNYVDREFFGYKNLKELHSRFDRHQLRRTKEFLNLPQKIYKDEYLELGSYSKEYHEIKNGILMELSEAKVISNPAVITLRLRQFLEKVKIPEMIDDIKEITDNGGSVVVFSTFRDNLIEMATQLRQCNIPTYVAIGGLTTDEKVSEDIAKFQSTNTPEVFLGTIQMLGTGFTLTKATYVMFLTKSWTVTDNEQAEDRCHRLDSRSNVTIINYIVQNSVDARVNEVLSYDKQNIDLVVDGKVVSLGSRDVLSYLLKE